MSDWQFLLITGLLALATMITRFVPFLIFGKKQKTPKIIEYLGKVLPAAMMGLLVAYCFKSVQFTDWRELVPAIVATGTVVGLHLWKRNTILSIAVGTAVYMILIRVM